jgi:hypothetical protein
MLHSTKPTSSSTSSEPPEIEVIYSSVLHGLNKGLKDKAESSENPHPVESDGRGNGIDEEGNELIFANGVWSFKLATAKKDHETSYEHVSMPPTQENAIKTARTSRVRQGEVGMANPGDANQADDPDNEVVEFSVSLDRPRWTRTTDEYMVLEFGSAGPITLRRKASS